MHVSLRLTILTKIERHLRGVNCLKERDSSPDILLLSKLHDFFDDMEFVAIFPKIRVSFQPRHTETVAFSVCNLGLRNGVVQTAMHVNQPRNFLMLLTISYTFIVCVVHLKTKQGSLKRLHCQCMRDTTGSNVTCRFHLCKTQDSCQPQFTLLQIVASYSLPKLDQLNGSTDGGSQPLR